MPEAMRSSCYVRGSAPESYGDLFFSFSDLSTLFTLEVLLEAKRQRQRQVLYEAKRQRQRPLTFIIPLINPSTLFLTKS